MNLPMSFGNSSKAKQGTKKAKVVMSIQLKKTADDLAKTPAAPAPWASEGSTAEDSSDAESDSGDDDSGQRTEEERKDDGAQEESKDGASSRGSGDQDDDDDEADVYGADCGQNPTMTAAATTNRLGCQSTAQCSRHRETRTS